MLMSSLIQEVNDKPNQQHIYFLQKLKSIVHEQLKKDTIIYTITNTNTSTTFHYYTVLDPRKSQYIELYWVADFSPQLISINVTYTTYRTLGIPVMINDLRTKIQVNFLLKLLNKNAPFFLTFLLNERNQVCINFSRNVFHESDRSFLLKSIKSIVSKLYQVARDQFQNLVNFLTIPIQICGRSFRGEKQTFESEEFNLIKLKNTFDRFRKNKERTAELIYEESDVLKMRKTIQGFSQIVGVDLRALQNLKFTTKEIQREKLLESIKNKHEIPSPAKVDKIAYQFQIIKVVQPEKKFDVNANSQIYVGKYSFRIFKTLIEEEKISKSQHFKRVSDFLFEEKDIIEERKCKLVKKKAMNKLSQKALRNQTSFLKFMRNQICLYIANYFLPLDNSWNQLYIEQYESSLLEIINSAQLHAFTTRLQTMLKLLNGLKFIVDSNICHRDIKPSNIMINNQNDPKIIDFGSTISAYNQKVIMSCNEKLCATEGYHFPYENCEDKIKQMFTRKQYESHPLFDIYSFAVIIENLFEPQLAVKAKNTTIKDTLTFIIQRCKENNPDNRLSYDEVMCLLLVLKKTLNPESKIGSYKPL